MRVTDRIVLEISGLVGGMMYPISVLPGPLRFLARLIPVTYSLEGMRAALLGSAGWRELWPSIAALLLFAAILIPLSFLVFAWALRRTKVTGTLTLIWGLDLRASEFAEITSSPNSILRLLHLRPQKGKTPAILLNRRGLGLLPCSDLSYLCSLVVVTMFEIKEVGQIADCRAILWHVWVIVVHFGIGQVVAAALAYGWQVEVSFDELQNRNMVGVIVRNVPWFRVGGNNDQRNARSISEKVQSLNVS
jgi:hypothetical protein